jgi:hypothetical protein
MSLKSIIRTQIGWAKGKLSQGLSHLLIFAVQRQRDRVELPIPPSDFLGEPRVIVTNLKAVFAACRKTFLNMHVLFLYINNLSV